MNTKINFEVDDAYVDRASKAKYVYEKYKPILKGKILDVGADQGYLKSHLSESVQYEGIGFSNQPFIHNIDLEKEKIPFPDCSFDCVLCLDVLEHLDNIHEIFDELCRASKEWVIISLPNPLAETMSMLHYAPYKPDRNTKFYGLPLEKEEDRHKWHFTSGEAKAFVEYRAKKNNFEVYNIHVMRANYDGIPAFKGWLGPLKRLRYSYARQVIFRKDLRFPDLYEGTQWYVLKRK